MSRRLVVEADGGSRGNPGPAGYGALVRDADTGEVLAERAAALGVVTNNVAEYQGLIAGLTAALDLDAGAVEVRMDSKLVVEQMAGRWQVKHPSMRPLARQAAALAARLPSVRWTWVPREANRAADRLANLAMDGTPVHRSGAPAVPPTVSPVVTPAAENRLPGWSPAPAEPHRLVLLRHGQTRHSVEKRFSGRSDPGLTDLGAAQAAAAARRLAAGEPVARVVTSPLRRAADTAAAVAAALGLVVGVEADLRETDFGDWEGLTFAEARDGWPEAFAAWLADPGLPPPAGESLLATGERVERAVRRLVGSGGAGGVSVVVSHTTPIKQLVRAALGAPQQALYRLQLDLAGITTLDCYPDGPVVLRGFNDTGHLDAAQVATSANQPARSTPGTSTSPSRVN